MNTLTKKLPVIIDEWETGCPFILIHLVSTFHYVAWCLGKRNGSLIRKTPLGLQLAEARQSIKASEYGIYAASIENNAKKLTYCIMPYPLPW